MSRFRLCAALVVFYSISRHVIEIRPLPKVDCTYQILVFNVILIDYALIRYMHGRWKKEIEELLFSQLFLSPESNISKLKARLW